MNLEAGGVSADLIEQVYAAFDRRQRRDDGRWLCTGGHFRDPVSGGWTDAEAGAIWRMFTPECAVAAFVSAETTARKKMRRDRRPVATKDRVPADCVRASFLVPCGSADAE